MSNLRNGVIGGSVAVMSALAIALAVPTPTYAQASAPQPLTATGADLSGNGLVNLGDAQQVESAWNSARKQGVCLRPDEVAADVNASGCVDVTDVQQVLANWGEIPDSDLRTRLTAPGVSADVNAGKTFTVNNVGKGTTADNDSNPGDGECRTSAGACTIRAAIQESNANVGRDTINFNVACPTDGVTPPAVVKLKGSFAGNNLTLDSVDNAGVVINGYSQCGASPNTGTTAGNAVIMIELLGTNVAGVHGLVVLDGNNVIRGLSIYNHDDNLRLQGSRATNNTIVGNFLGTGAGNSFKGKRNGLAENVGLRLRNKANNNTIGGTSPADRNIVSGNAADGIYLEERADFNRFINNYIGLRQDGLTHLGNRSDGFDVNIGCQNNIIGGPTNAERNVITGNESDGIEFSHTRNGERETRLIKVQNNYIGVSATGGKTQYIAESDGSRKNATFSNGSQGVTLEDQVREAEIFDNVIAFNGRNGIRLYYKTTENNIHDNLIGVNRNGDALGNGLSKDDEGQGRNGILLLAGSFNNTIKNNIIAYNQQAGVRVTNARQNAQDTSFTYLTEKNRISQNSIFDNAEKGIELDDTTDKVSGIAYWPQGDIQPPFILSANQSFVAGKACSDCTVELFVAKKGSGDIFKSRTGAGTKDAGEGQTYRISGQTNSDGYFLIDITSLGLAVNTPMTGTATDALGNTSEFGWNVTVKAGTTQPTAPPTSTPSPTATSTPTNTPTATPTATPTLQPGQPTPTLQPGQPTPTVVGGPTGSSRINLPLIVR